MEATDILTLFDIVAPFLFGAIGYLVKEVVDKRKNEDIVQEALKELLRDSLERQVDKWKPKGVIRRIDKQKYIATKGVYERLIGTNGFIEELDLEINALEVLEDEN